MSSPSSTTTPVAALTGKVVYIEDDPVSVAAVESLVEAHPGVQLLHAANGLDGVQLVRRERPAFVLLDMHLPDISGLEVVRRLSEDIATHGLRVTLLTADRLTMDVIKAMSLGAFEYWVKPMDSRVFEGGLRRALTGKPSDPSRTLAQLR